MAERCTLRGRNTTANRIDKTMFTGGHLSWTMRDSGFSASGFIAHSSGGRVVATMTAHLLACQGSGSSAPSGSVACKERTQLNCGTTMHGERRWPNRIGTRMFAGVTKKGCRLHICQAMSLYSIRFLFPLKFPRHHVRSEEEARFQMAK